MDNHFKQRYGNWALVTGATSGTGAELAEQIKARPSTLPDADSNELAITHDTGDDDGNSARI